MKKLLLFVSLIIGNILLAQSPQFINYQAVIRDANGGVIANQTIGLKLEITQGQTTYTEILSIGTNSLGLVNLQVGQNPAPNSIPFSDINWAAGNASLTTWYDPTNSLSNWQNIGTSNLASVPYALYAENVFSGDFNDLANVPNLDTSNTNEFQILSQSGDTISLSNGGGAVVVSSFSGDFGDLVNVPSLDTSNSNELQNLSLFGDTIFLSNGGGFVYFPTFSGDFNDLANVPNLDTSNTNEFQILSQSGDTISLSNGGGAVVVSSFSGDFGDLVNVPNLDTSNTNELQVLSISGDTIFLSGGGFVVLPLSLKAEQINDLSDGKTSNTSLALGANALQNNSVGINNTAVGQNALMLDTIGTGNTAVGFESLKNSGHSDENTAIGQHSLKSNVHGSYNVAVGYKASENNFTGEHNTALGHSALMTNSVGVENTAIGKNSQKFSTVDGNTSVGANSLANNTTGNSNVAIGLYSLNANILGSSNTAVGKNALKHTLGNNNTALGKGALEIALGSSNTAIGANSLKDYVGTNFGFNTQNVAIGYNAGIGLKYGISNVLIGSSISARGSVNNNVIIGTNAGDLDSLSTGNVFIGNSTRIGHNASKKLGYYNTVIGTMAFAGSGAAYSTGDSVYNSVALGYQAWAKESNTIQLGNSAITNVNTFGALRAGDTASSVQDKGLLVYGSTSGPTGPTGQFIRSKDRNNVLTFLDLDEENGGSVGLLSTIYRGSNVVGISAKNASGWTQPLIVELGARTNSLVIKESQSVELIDGTIVKGVTDTSAINESAALEVKSNSKGFLPPRMSASQRDAISNPTIGLEVYCTDCGQGGSLSTYNGSNWTLVNQQLSITGDTLRLTNSNYVILPTTGQSVQSLDDLNDAISNSTQLAIGSGALNSTTTATDNVAIGLSALTNINSGGANIAIGTNTMRNVTTGNHNTAIGYHALYQNIIGSRNTALGSRAMFYASGSDNIALGEQALYSSSGGGNIAVGNGSLYGNSTGGSNTAVGYGSMGQNTTGGGNTSFGSNALSSNITGSNNLALGNNANVGSQALTNAIAIGYNSVVAASNSIQLGNSAITNVNTFGALRAGDTASSVQDKGLLVYGSTSGPTGPTGQFIRSKDRNNVLTFLDLDEENGGSVGLYSTSYQGTNFVGISAKNASGWTRPLIVELGASTNSLVIKESESIELVDGTIVKEISDTTTVSESAALEIKSTTKGLLFPRMTQAQRDAIQNPVAGLAIFCLDIGNGELQVYNGTQWLSL